MKETKLTLRIPTEIIEAVIARHALIKERGWHNLSQNALLCVLIQKGLGVGCGEECPYTIKKRRKSISAAIDQLANVEPVPATSPGEAPVIEHVLD